jgi:hypothetical protein
LAKSPVSISTMASSNRCAQAGINPSTILSVTEISAVLEPRNQLSL